MITFIVAVMVYAFIGGVVGSRHHALVSRTCEWASGEKRDRDGDIETCIDPRWCNHIYRSVWMFGVFWWLALPASAGFLIGSSNKDTRIERRRTRELEEAKHKVELARLARQEDAELDLQLAAAQKYHEA